MGDNAFPFRRLTRTISFDIGPTPTKITIPDGFIPKTASSFYIYTAINCATALTGTTSGPYQEVDPNSPGWVWGPNHTGVYSTQRPIFMSAVAIPLPGMPAVTGKGFISWGIGT